jgi:hypothetical protein
LIVRQAHENVNRALRHCLGLQGNADEEKKNRANQVRRNEIVPNLQDSPASQPCARVGRTLLSAAFDFDLDLRLKAIAKQPVPNRRATTSREQEKQPQQRADKSIHPTQSAR